MNKRIVGLVLLIVPFIVLTVTIAMFAFDKLIVAKLLISDVPLPIATYRIPSVILSILGLISLVGIVILAPIGAILLAKGNGRFSIGKALSTGWHATKQRFWLYVAVSLTFLVISWTLSFILGFFANNTLLFAAVYVLDIAINFLLSIGIIKITIAAAQGGEVHYAMLFNGGALLWKFFLTNVVYGLLMLATIAPALILTLGAVALQWLNTPVFVTLGVLWFATLIALIRVGIKYTYSTYFVVDKLAGPIDAIKGSGRITSGALVHLFCFSLVTALINIAGMIPLFLGLFVTIPLTGIASAYVYRELLARKN